MQTPFHNRDSFTRAIERELIRADEEGRGDDVDRVVAHLSQTPGEVNKLTSFLLLIDEEWRIPVRREIDAFRRWGKQKGQTTTDDEIIAVMLGVYDRRREKS